jgi:Zn-dependent protease
MQNWWVQSVLENDGPVYLISWIVWVIGAIVLHELAHGWVAIALGDRTPVESGHMTLNPIVHMGQASLFLFALFGIAWGMMPVNPNRLRGRHADAIVSLAGPLMNVLLCGLSLVGLVVWIGCSSGKWGGRPIGDPLAENVFNFLWLGIRLNLLLAAFNLLPVPPLDGSHILGSLVPATARMWQGPNAGLIGMIAFAFVFLVAGDYVDRYTGDAAARLVLWGLRIAHLQLPVT